MFDGMALFCAVVTENSLSAAARLTGHTPSHVSKEVARLEHRLGTRLLNRTTRKISLTETGQIYYDNARRIVEDTRCLDEQIKALGTRPFGELRMSVPAIYADGHLNTWLPEFMETYPEISLTMDVSDRHVDLIAEGYDLTVRIGKLAPSGLISREIAKTLGITVASPRYLHEYGTPMVPEDIAHHRTIIFDTRSALPHWIFAGSQGQAVTIAVKPSVRCSDAAMERSLAKSGKGITRLPFLACEADIADGSLVRILQNFEPEPFGIHIIYASRDHMPLKTRAMIDFLVEKSLVEKSKRTSIKRS